LQIIGSLPAGCDSRGSTGNERKQWDCDRQERRQALSACRRAE